MKAAIGLAIAAVLAQIAYPLTDPGSDRDRLTVLTVVLFFLASVTAALVARGPRFAALLVAVTAGGGFVVEAIGTATGLPFGSYAYADRLGPRLLDVPLLVPLAWTMVGYPAWVAARRLTRSRWRVVVAGWALASWDLFLDPQLVAAGHWRWSEVELALPGVPDVPVSNYLGWLLVAILMMAAIDHWGGGRRADDRLPIALYLWTYASSVLAHAAFLDLRWSALYGGVAMGLVAVPLAILTIPRTRLALGLGAVAVAGAAVTVMVVDTRPDTAALPELGAARW